MAHFEAARAAAPKCAMAELSKAWLHAMSNDPTGVATARAAIANTRLTLQREAIFATICPYIVLRL